MSTNIYVISDIHLEFRYDDPDEINEFIELISTTADKDGVLILAGDLGNIMNRDHLAILKQHVLPLYKYVLFVAGNHDYYHGTYEAVTKKLRDFEKDCNNFKFLDNEYIELDGVRYLGGTMWYADSPYARRNNYRMMPDCRHVQDLEKWVYRSHDGFVKLLLSHCREGDVVISHHSCSQKSIPSMFANSPANYFFCSDQEHLIKSLKPAIWAHGHTHTKFVYKLDNTMVVCNPYGYPDEKEQESPVYLVKTATSVRIQ